MSKLKLSIIDDDKPVRITVDLPASLHRDLVTYGDAMSKAAGSGSVTPQKLIVPMLLRFIASDRGFAGVKRGRR